MKTHQNKLTLIKRNVKKRGPKYWLSLFLCSCGKEILTRFTNVTSGKTRSCGCLCIEAAKRSIKHNLCGHQLYKVWQGMKRRCYHKKYAGYKNYGGRGIIICDEWKTQFINFYNWAINNGYQKGLTIERLKVNENYCPENCTWIPKSQQSSNTRRTIGFEKATLIRQSSLSQKEAAKFFGISCDSISNIRLNKIYKI